MAIGKKIKSLNKQRQKYYTVKEIAALLKLHEETIRRAIRQGRLEGVKFGRDYRIQHENLMRFLEQKHFRIESKTSQMEARKGTVAALKEVFNTWAGDDAEDIADQIMSTRTSAEF